VTIEFQHGKVCGDTRDLVDGRPVGSVRISFGRQSTFADLHRFLRMVYDCFITDPEVSFTVLLTDWNVSELVQCEADNPFVPPPVYERNLLRTRLLSLPILTDIWLYPVKSCVAMRVEKWPLATTGLAFDRSWMVTTRDGIGLTQKRCSRLCFVHASVDCQAQTLTLSAPEMVDSSVEVPLSSLESQTDQQRVCSDRYFIISS
jgi:molybdenum cofactor sulfurtransferase